MKFSKKFTAKGLLCFALSMTGLSTLCSPIQAYGSSSLNPGEEVFVQRITDDEGEFSPWKSNDVRWSIRDETVISIYNKPSKSNTKYLVFLGAGQQTPGTGGGGPNDFTGQPDDYKSNHLDGTRSAHVPVRASLITDILGTGKNKGKNFNPSTTFVAAAWDVQFNWGRSKSIKNDIEDSYFEWLSSKFYASKLEGIVFIGHSRGGCLSLRLAQRFRDSYPDIPIVLQSYDSVCNYMQGEFGTQMSAIRNPMKASWNTRWEAHKTDINIQFNSARRSKLAILHTVSGERVLFGSDAHAFTHKDAADEVYDIGWYKQIWSDEVHSQVDKHSRESTQKKHLFNKVKTLFCGSSANVKWHNGRCEQIEEERFLTNADFEPNDHWSSAKGRWKLEHGTWFKGKIESSGAEDWTYAQLSGNTKITLKGAYKTMEIYWYDSYSNDLVYMDRFSVDSVNRERTYEDWFNNGEYYFRIYNYYTGDYEFKIN